MSHEVDPALLANLVVRSRLHLSNSCHHTEVAALTRHQPSRRRGKGQLSKPPSPSCIRARRPDGEGQLSRWASPPRVKSHKISTYGVIGYQVRYNDLLPGRDVLDHQFQSSSCSVPVPTCFRPPSSRSKLLAVNDLKVWPRDNYHLPATSLPTAWIRMILRFDVQPKHSP